MNSLHELEEILNNENITTVFQPIVSLLDGSIIGYEALSRGPETSPLYSPDKLFSTAEEFNKTWDLELACRTKAIERSKNLINDKLLFLNVDPKIIKDKKFQKGLTKEFLVKNNISPDSIIFEITERTAISDYKNFVKILRNYTDQGYKIAIDDTGAGYSGLKTLCETKPHYIKIDIELIKNIDTDSFKQALVKALVEFSKTTNTKLIAEGIETEAELKTLIAMDVYAGQGFFLKRPSEDFNEIPPYIKDTIIKYNNIKTNSFDITNSKIGEIAENHQAFEINTLCCTIKKYFSLEGASGACIINNDIPVGLVMKHTLDSMLATQYGVAVFNKRPVYLIMDSHALTVDYNTNVSAVVKMAMQRSNETLYDYVIVTNNSKYYGIVTIKNLLEFTTAIEKEYAKELNPLTGLPGNVIIQRKFDMALTSNSTLGILYFDLDNFKVYNDNYGFENGDKILKFTANLIKEQVTALFPACSFVGHIGGDDFVCIIETSIESCKKLSDIIINEFDTSILTFFNEQDRLNGYIEAFDRNGNKDIFNLTSISIAGICGNTNLFKTSDDLALYVSKLKKKSKKIKHSSYVIENI